MSDARQEHVYPGGQHYSGTNRVPNIQDFIRSLDRDKRERDARIDAEHKKKASPGEVTTPVVEPKRPGSHLRTVRDPVTGRDVEIDDISTQQLKDARNPKVGEVAVHASSVLTVLTTAAV